MFTSLVALVPNTMHSGFVVLVSIALVVVHAVPTLRSSSMKKLEASTGGLANMPEVAIAEQLASASDN